MLTYLSKNTIYRYLIGGLWFLLILGLPVTSFPLLANLTGAIVAPASAIPLAMLIILWFVPYLIEGGKLPLEVLPYLYFVLYALIISAAAFFLNGHYDRGRDFFDQSLRAFVTVIIGLSFYLFISAFPNNERKLQQTLLFISMMGMIILPWTLFEVDLLRKYTVVQGFPDWVNKLRSFLAVQSPNAMFTNRVSGFAYEPSWFVRIFDLVLFPIWLAAIFYRKTFFKIRLWKFQVEDLLMVVGLVVFGYSSPRIGLVAFLASLAFLGIILLKRLTQWLTNLYQKTRKKPLKNTFWVKTILTVLILVILFGMSFGAVTAYINAASSWDYRFQMFLDQASLEDQDFFPLTESKIIYLARDLAFLERMIFWFGGWRIFRDYPFGVGLGNAGFYFFDRMPGAGFDSFEVRNLAYRASYLANTKNLWTRLLSETGFIGLALFLAWLYLLWRSAALSRKSKSGILQVVGLAGQLFLLAYIFESLSMDSFAMPYQWVMAGLISAGGLLARRELRLRDNQPESESAADQDVSPHGIPAE